MNKETFYFSHDYNARSDSKIKKLIVKHGFAGYGLYWSIVEDLYQNANALQTDYDCIAFDLHTDSKVIKSIVEDFGLFEIKDGYFGSLSIQRRLDERDKKSQTARDTAFKRWNKEGNAKAMQTHSEGNAIYKSKGNESILEENKINNNEINEFKAALLELKVSENLVNVFCDIRKAKKQRFDHAAFFTLKYQIEKSQRSANECIEIAVNHGWADFSCEWLKNLKDLPPIQYKEYKWRHMTDISGGKDIYRGTKEKYERDVRSYGETIILVSDGN
jgi:CRISPR/Cas system-associated protein endoribonuclease Cas2